MRKFILVLMCLVLLSSVIFAGGNRQNPGQDGKIPLRVVWWGGDIRHRITLEVIELFEAAHPNITVIPEYMGTDAYFERLTVQLQGGTAPDVIQLGGVQSIDYAQNGHLLALNGYRGNILSLPGFDEDVLTINTLDGNLYGISLGANSRVYIYNKSLLERAGAPLPPKLMSWEELRRYCLSIAPLLPAGVFPLNDDGGNDATIFFAHFSRENGRPLHRDGESFVTEADILTWLNRWEGFRADRIIPDPETAAQFSGSIDVSMSMLVRGRAVITQAPSNQFVAYQNAMSDELELMLLPNPTSKANWFQPSQAFSIYRRSSYPDEAAAFINFFVTDLEAGRILGNERGIPSSQHVREVLLNTTNQEDRKLFAFFSDFTDYSSPMDIPIPNTREFNNTFLLYYQQVMFNRITRNQGAQEIYNLIQSLLIPK